MSVTAGHGEDGDVLYEVVGPVALITLNRPSVRNALSVDAIARLAAYAGAAQADEGVRAVVVTGAGDRAFCAGGDLGELIPALTDERRELFEDPTKRFFSDLFKPVVAAVNGPCLAGGFELLLGTDLRVASSTATFGLSETRVGLIPGAGTHVRLPAQVPWAIAMQLLLTAEPIDAERAREVGLVNEVVAPADVFGRAMEIATVIAGNAPLAVRTAKEIAVRAQGHEAGFVLESALNRRVLASGDAREGPRAFLEGRPPRFVGR